MFEPDEMSGRIRQLRIVWFALLMSIAAFAGVAGFLLRSGGLAVGQTLSRGALTYGAVVTVLILPLAQIVRRKIQAVPPSAGGEEVARRWQAGWIVGQALRGVVGVLGLTIALLSGSITWVWAFAAASLVSMLLSPPWEHELRIRVRRADADQKGPPDSR
jgi:hypothetical protein